MHSIHTHICTNTHACMCSDVNRGIDPGIYAHIRAHTHTHKQLHIQMGKREHTHTHITVIQIESERRPRSSEKVFNSIKQNYQAEWRGVTFNGPMF